MIIDIATTNNARTAMNLARWAKIAAIALRMAPATGAVKNSRCLWPAAEVSASSRSMRVGNSDDGAGQGIMQRFPMR